ncbi:MAG: hypothetical protein P1U80_05020 [Pseudomonadales bacterium]|jgi:hypothetical protein|nr:hypothetical protein [Pseudomonadales bacterium]
MNNNWIKRNAWIAHFDILGFKSLLENDGGSVVIEVLKSQFDDALATLSTDISRDFEEDIDYLFFADTFVIYTKSEKIREYPALISVSKRFISKCLSMRLPIRGAVSYGDVVFGYDYKVLMGKAFLESHEYGEDQNWLGLILTPSATAELQKNELDPERHGFVSSDIPLRNLCGHSDSVFAYRFIDGATSFKCPLLFPLNDMMSRAPESQKIKYRNTIEFINKHYASTNGINSFHAT